jgi:hypothetical protein
MEHRANVDADFGSSNGDDRTLSVGCTQVSATGLPATTDADGDLSIAGAGPTNQPDAAGLIGPPSSTS